MTLADLYAIEDGAEPLPLHRFLTFRLMRVHTKLNAQATRILRETSGLTLSQWRVLALIGAEGEARMSDIARATALDKGLLSRNLKALIEAGQIEANADDADHRAQKLRLSAAGQALFERTLPVMRARQARLRADLSAEELETFYTVLDKLEHAAEA